jgi:hypothetical protein
MQNEPRCGSFLFAGNWFSVPMNSCRRTGRAGKGDGSEVGRVRETGGAGLSQGLTKVIFSQKM